MITGKELVPSRNLAVGILYLLARAATVYFPGSTRAHPSPFARILQQQEGPLPGFAKALLPLDVRENIWRLVAVPVLESDLGKDLFFSSRFSHRKRDYFQILNTLQAAVDQAYKDAGFAP